MMVDMPKVITSLVPSLPLDRQVVNKEGILTDTWHQFLDQLVSSMKNSFSIEGYLMPSQDATNIALLTADQSVGRFLIDNTDPDNVLLKINLTVSGTPTWLTVETV